jgi:hypothetical protein
LEPHDVALIVVFSIAVTEGDFSVMGGENSIIGKRHAVGVAGEVIEDRVGGSEGFFGVDDPSFLPQRFKQERKGSSIC